MLIIQNIKIKNCFSYHLFIKQFNIELLIFASIHVVGFGWDGIGSDWIGFYEMNPLILLLGY